ncbi:MAG: hypothetical protein ACPG49_04670, partial [Chitinophagales bacterium]
MKTLFHFVFSLLILSFCSPTSIAQIFQPNSGMESFKTPPTTYPSSTTILNMLNLDGKTVQIKNPETGLFLSYGNCDIKYGGQFSSMSQIEPYEANMSKSSNTTWRIIAVQNGNYRLQSTKDGDFLSRITFESGGKEFHILTTLPLDFPKKYSGDKNDKNFYEIHYWGINWKIAQTPNGHFSLENNQIFIQTGKHHNSDVPSITYSNPPFTSWSFNEVEFNNNNGGLIDISQKEQPYIDNTVRPTGGG